MLELKPQLYLIGAATDRMMAAFREVFDVHVHAEIKDRVAFLAQNGAAITAVATNGHDGVPVEVFEGLPNLKVISCYGVGYDAIDVQAAASRGIVVTHTPNVLNNDVANTAILLLLALSRDLVAEDAHVRSGAWVSQGNLPLTPSIEGKKIGILGLGRIGETIARKLSAFDCQICYHSRNKRDDVDYEYYPDLVAMAQDCWGLIAITPGGPSTQNIVNKSVLEAIGPDGIFVNVARGSVVDEPALIAALSSGKLGRAGLDVFADEPRVPAELCDLKNVILTPHIASGTIETRQAMGDLVVENLKQFIADGSVISPVPECASIAKIR